MYKRQLHTCEWLERQGFEVTYLDVDENGRINPADVEAAIRPDTIPVSYTHLDVYKRQPVDRDSVLLWVVQSFVILRYSLWMSLLDVYKRQVYNSIKYIQFV